MSTQRPDAERIYQKFVTASPALPSVGLVCIIGRTVMAESVSSECGGDENKYYNICSVCKVSIVICGCFGFLKVLSFALFPLDGLGKS